MAFRYDWQDGPLPETPKDETRFTEYPAKGHSCVECVSGSDAGMGWIKCQRSEGCGLRPGYGGCRHWSPRYGGEMVGEIKEGETFLGLIHAESPKAILFQDWFWESPDWLPKSQVSVSRFPDVDEVYVRASRWICEQKDIREPT